MSFVRRFLDSSTYLLDNQKPYYFSSHHTLYSVWKLCSLNSVYYFNVVKIYDSIYFCQQCTLTKIATALRKWFSNPCWKCAGRHIANTFNVIRKRYVGNIAKMQRKKLRNLATLTLFNDRFYCRFSTHFLCVPKGTVTKNIWIYDLFLIFWFRIGNSNASRPCVMGFIRNLSDDVQDKSCWFLKKIFWTSINRHSKGYTSKLLIFFGYSNIFHKVYIFQKGLGMCKSLILSLSLSFSKVKSKRWNSSGGRTHQFPNETHPLKGMLPHRALQTHSGGRQFSIQNICEKDIAKSICDQQISLFRCLIPPVWNYFMIFRQTASSQT